MAHNEQDVPDLMNYTWFQDTLNPEQEYVTISWQRQEDSRLDSRKRRTKRRETSIDLKSR